MSDLEHVIWHDLECGGYRQDLALWRELAGDSVGPILDVGAGTGRVTLELARGGHRMVALDLDAVLLAELGRRASGLPAGSEVVSVCADARSVTLPGARFSLCLVPMQTIQLLGGREGRLAFLARVRGCLLPGGVLAVAIAPDFEEFVLDEGEPGPLPDIVELEGTVYASQPTAVRVDGDTVVLERRREVIDPRGGRRVSEDRIALDVLDAAGVITEGAVAGLRPLGTRTVPESDEHVGSQVVILGA